ncbi:MAG: hypothetical protein KKB37_17350 [Alphaproteobacteria bacterium]|nr:hypothetical protein [Alphaproteobacteria bacterium]
MRVYIADEASPVVTRYTDIQGVDFRVRLLLTCAHTQSAESRARIMAMACDALEPESLFVDSGAFGLSSHYYKHGKVPSVAEATDILRNHLGACKWLVDNGYPLAAVAELDLQELYGNETVLAWRDKYVFPFQEQTGVDVVLSSIHRGDTPEDRIRFLLDDRVRYIGMSAIMNLKKAAETFGSKEKYFELMRSMAGLCFDAGVKFHGYAVTRTNLLKKVPYYSCDSISWQQALHFGGALAFDSSSGNLVRVDAGKGLIKKKGAKALARNIVRIQSHGSKLKPLDVIGRKKVKGRPRSDHHAVFLDQARVFAQMEDFYTAYWRLKGYDWDKQLELVRK